jgi:hypothetical protein
MADAEVLTSHSAPPLNLSDMLPGLEASEQELLTRLGIGVVAIWADLPRNTQRLLFEAASAAGTEHGHGIREKIARFLHDNGNPDHNTDQAPCLA